MYEKEKQEWMKQRDGIQKNASETGDKDDWKKYKHIRNQINNRLRYEESKWQRMKINSCGEDSSKFGNL